MTYTTRQNTLFVADDWKLIYDQLSAVDFTSLDFQSLRSVIFENIRNNYPEDYNDWIGSSEFIIKMDTLVYLAQILAYRFDVNARENYRSTAERRESILKLAYNLAYSVSRVKGGTGKVKIKAIRTSQTVYDLDNLPIRGDVLWNDPTDPDWYDKWIAVLNAALDVRSKWGRPIRKYADAQSKIHLYRLNSPSPSNGVYAFDAKTSTSNIPFEVCNTVIDEETGIVSEVFPDRFSSFHLQYQNEGDGFSSDSGFYFPIKQGQMQYQIVEFTDPVPNSTIEINNSNIGGDVWVGKVNSANDLIEEWTQLDTIQNLSMGYQPDSVNKRVYEVVTRENDQVTIRFGDGKFGEIPTGRFIVWYRTVSSTPYTIRPKDIQNVNISIPYVSNGEVFQLTLTVSLDSLISNAAASETNEQITERSGAVFHTQNRMVTGSDYNGFPLSDSTILKIKAVNRTFAGHGRSMPANDVTGTYKQTTFLGTDGRLFRREVTDINRYSWTPATESVSTFISTYIEPAIDTEEASLLYYSKYPLRQINGITFTVTSTVGSASYGKLNSSVLTGPLSKMGRNTLVRFSSGVLARINEIVANTDGTADNTIRLKSVVPFGNDGVSAYLPAIRRSFSDAEVSNVSEMLSARQSFGLRWDADTATWSVIRSENINFNGAFSLSNTGDVSNSELDASWFVYLEYVNQTDGHDYWDIYARGISMEFESESQVEFFHAAGTKAIHPQTGQVVYDQIVLTHENETRNSLPRRSLRTALGPDKLSGKVLIEGTGSQSKFQTNIPATALANTFVLNSSGEMVLGSEWSAAAPQGVVEVTFSSIPTLGAIYYVVVDPRRVHLAPSRNVVPGNSTDVTFTISNDYCAPDNTFVFKNKVLQVPLRDYSVFQALSQTRIRTNTAVSTGTNLVSYSFAGGDSCWTSVTEVATGLTKTFALGMKSYHVMAFINGIRTWDFTIDTSLETGHYVVLDDMPTAGDVVHFRIVFRSDVVAIEESSFIAEASQSTINLPFFNPSATRLFMFINGEFREELVYDETLDDVFLSSSLQGGETVHLTHVSMASGMSSSYSTALSFEVDAHPELLLNEKKIKAYAPLTHDDGFINTRGIRVTNVDEDNSGDVDDPFLFRDFVIDTGSVDLVLWRSVVENGYDVWVPISETTIPRGTYHSPRHIYAEGDSIGSAPAGSIHYDSRGDEWLVADLDTETWIIAPDQAKFRYAVGRDKLKFRWEHYADVDRTLDPSPSNIIDMYVLTAQYDDQVRSWLDGSTSDTPVVETGAELKQMYGSLEKYKMISDSIVWNPARYKYLFGDKADPAYRGKFLIIKATGSVLPDTDLKLRVLDAIDSFFDSSLWDFGESFYFTQLSTYIHQALAGEVHSVVIVSTANDEFGHLFQARCQPDEIFVSAASVADLEVVNTFNRDNMVR